MAEAEEIAPRRVQLSRKRGWRMPENTVKVDRSTNYGNPFLPVTDGSLDQCIALFRDYAERVAVAAPEWLDELRGKNLACWCKLGAPCHADVLLELANSRAVAAEVRKMEDGG